jgi:hypothetical protein
MGKYGLVTSVERVKFFGSKSLSLGGLVGSADDGLSLCPGESIGVATPVSGAFSPAPQAELLTARARHIPTIRSAP